MNKEKADIIMLEDSLRQVADSLRSLCLTIDTLSVGLVQEKAERQFLASMNSIRHCVKDIWAIAHEALELLDEENENGMK